MRNSFKLVNKLVGLLSHHACFDDYLPRFPVGTCIKKEEK